MLRRNFQDKQIFQQSSKTIKKKIIDIIRCYRRVTKHKKSVNGWSNSICVKVQKKDKRTSSKREEECEKSIKSIGRKKRKKEKNL
jgi:hypothetical protein